MIRTYYPNYYKWETYPANQCAIIHKTTGEWGILHNMATSPITIDGVTFKCSETLFQLMKFTDKEVVVDVYRHNNKKWAMHWEKTHRRDNWPQMIIDALKFCLQKKYEQCEVLQAEQCDDISDRYKAHIEVQIQDIDKTRNNRVIG